jgi:hypothetical protein
MMKSRQYRRFLDKLEISQARAGEMLGLTPRTSRRYAADDTAIPGAVDIVLRMMIKHKYTPDDIDKLKREALL